MFTLLLIIIRYFPHFIISLFSKGILQLLWYAETVRQKKKKIRSTGTGRADHDLTACR